MPPKAWPPSKPGGTSRAHRYGRKIGHSSSVVSASNPGIVSTHSSTQAKPMMGLGNSDKEDGELTEDEESREKSTNIMGEEAPPDSTHKAQVFITAWRQNGYSFMDLADEGFNTNMLRDIYTSLGIDSGVNRHSPSSQSILPASKTDLSDKSEDFFPAPEGPHMNNNATTSIQSMAGAEHVIHSTLPTNPSKPQSSLNQREDYIARLKAAKSNKATSRQEALSPVDKSLDPLNAVPLSSAQPTSPLPTDGKQFLKRLLVTNPSIPSASTMKDTIPLETLPAASVMPTFAPPVGSNSVAPVSSGNDRLTTVQGGGGDSELARLRLRALKSIRPDFAAKTMQPTLATDPASAATKPSISNLTTINTVAQNTATCSLATSSMTPQTVDPKESSSDSTAGFFANPPLSLLQRDVRGIVDINSSSTNVQSHSENNYESTTATTPKMSPIITRIPGLFMTSSSADLNAPVHEKEDAHGSTLSLLLSQNQPLVAKRKRPVAADFDNDPSSPTTKKMFGHPRGHPYNDDVVIEASDEESEHGEAEGRGSSPKNVMRIIPLQEQLGQQPSATGSSIPTPATGNQSPNGSHSPLSTPTTTPNLRSHEAQIRIMKVRIAEMEQKRKAKSLASGVTTPAISIAQQDLNILAEPIHPAAKVGSAHLSSSMPAPALPDGATHESSVDVFMETVTGATIGRLEKDGESPMALSNTSQADENVVQLLEWKKRRRLEIEAGLPALDASLSSSQSRLEILKAQLQELEATMRREAEERIRLVEELQSLGVETQGLSNTELKDARAEALAHTFQNRTADQGQTSSACFPLALPQSKEHAHQEETRPTVIRGTPDRDSTNGINDVRTLPLSIQGQAHLRVFELRDNKDSTQISDVLADCDKKAPDCRVAPDEATTIDHVGRESSTLEVNILNPLDGHGGDLDNETYSPQSHQDHSQIGQGSSTSSTGAAGNNAVNVAISNGIGQSSEMSSEISESSGDEEIPLQALYEEQFSSSGGDSNGDEWLPDALSPMAGSEVAQDAKSVGSDSSYEPPDAGSVSSHVNFSTSQLEPADEESLLPLAIDRNPFDRATNADSEAARHAAALKTELALDSSRATMVWCPLGLLDPMLRDPQVSSKATDGQHSYFTPYESPLARFKAYRFHTDFPGNVTSGFRSSTYSHSIDPQRPICAYETAGGVCNDSSCGSQHFRDTAMTDHELLKQLGTSVPAELTPEKRQDYLNGLSEAIAGLRARNTQDADQVAAEIISYRRRFLEDLTKVLNR